MFDRRHLNVLTSFGHSIIYTVMLSEIYKTHLDPRIGYLHTTNFRRFILNLDAAEIFKPIIIDRLETTINHKSLGRSVSYRRLLRLELYKLEKHLMGEQTYEPFVASW